jgi:hypothetical protein
LIIFFGISIVAGGMDARIHTIARMWYVEAVHLFYRIEFKVVQLIETPDKGVHMHGRDRAIQ